MIMSNAELAVLETRTGLGDCGIGSVVTTVGQENNDVRYLLIADQHDNYLVVERKADGEWMYGQKIKKDQVSRYITG